MARRRIPAQAFGLKKYRSGISPVSKMSDSEHALAPLRHAEVLCVQHCPRERIPDLIHCSQEKPKVSSFGGRQEAGHVLEDEPTGCKSSNNSQGDEGQVAARVIQAKTFSGDAVGLAGASENKNVWPGDGSGARREVIGGHVSKVDRMRVPSREHCCGKLLDLGGPRPTPIRHRRLWRADPGKERGCDHEVHL